MLHASMRRLEVFVAVADTGGFATAAAQLAMSQPSVSAHIKALERELDGPPLFHRHTGRRPQLSEAGLGLLDQARLLLKQAGQIAMDAKIRRTPSQQPVVLACQSRLATFFLPDILANFAREQPQIRLTVRSDMSQSVDEQVRLGCADLGCFLGHGNLENLAARRIGRLRYVVMASPDHPLASRHRIRPVTLGRYPFIRGPENASLTQEIGKAAASIGLNHMNVAAEVTDLSTSRAMAAAGVGLFWTLRLPARQNVGDYRLVELDIDAAPVMVSVNLVWSNTRPVSGAAMELARYISRIRLP